ncbi:STAS domain-containing protein [Nocardioides aquiterrae]|uniref:Anti-sigma factor antagonist n=1 Tax=Nocardioides aquiterrae TaxID=203799 RepID=A0ABP4EVE0_9ACTN
MTGVTEHADDGLLELSVEAGEASCVLRLSGELDVYTTARLRAALTQQLVDEGRVHVVVDLTGVTFLDSSGLGTLVRAQRQARGLRGSFAVVCGEGPVLRVMSLTGLTHVLRVHDTLEAATAELPRR